MMRISRAEEYYLGSNRAGFQGRARIGFGEDGKVRAVDMYLVQGNGPNNGFPDFNSAAGAVSIEEGQRGSRAFRQGLETGRESLAVPVAVIGIVRRPPTFCPWW